MEYDTKLRWILVIIIIILISIILLAFYHWYLPEHDYYCLKEISKDYCKEKGMEWEKTMKESPQWGSAFFRCVETMEGGRQTKLRSYDFLNKELTSCETKPARSWR